MTEKIDEIEAITYLIEEDAEKTFKKFNAMTADEGLRNCFLAYHCLFINHLIDPNNINTLGSLRVVKQNIIHNLQNPQITKTIIAGK